MICPAVGSSSRVTSRPVVVLPQPDSPTSDSVSPWRTEKSTPSTAWTAATGRLNTPPRTGKCLTSPVTDSSTSPGCRVGSRAWSIAVDTGPPQVVDRVSARLGGTDRSELGSYLLLEELTASRVRQVAGDEVGTGCPRAHSRAGQRQQLGPLGPPQPLGLRLVGAARVERAAARHVDEAG